MRVCFCCFLFKLKFVNPVPLAWKMAFKISAGTGDVSYDAWSQEGVHDGGAGCSLDPGTPCSGIYKDAVVDDWNNISQVRN